MKNLLAILLILTSILIYRGRYQKESILSQNVTEKLTKAANANTIEIAKEELSQSLAYLESKKLTKGFTSLIWKTKNENIGYWFKNLETNHQKLKHSKLQVHLRRYKY